MNDKPDMSIENLLNEEAIDPKRLHEEAAKLTRQRILVAASKCFAEKGYQKTTIREIAANAGVTLGAVYHHFKEKKELLMIVNRSRQVRSLDITREAMEKENDFFEGLRAGLRGQFRLLAEDPVLRGVFREYMGMAHVDPDINQMHAQNDLEFRDLFAKGLERCFPQLSDTKRSSLARMLLVSFQGLISYLLVSSPIGKHYEEILDGLINTFRCALQED